MQIKCFDRLCNVQVNVYTINYLQCFHLYSPQGEGWGWVEGEMKKTLRRLEREP